MSRLELRLLGGFEVRLDGRQVEGFESQKSRALLAYLALHRERPCERRMLASLLWSERPDSSARRNLRQALHNIRCAFDGDGSLPPLFTGERGTVRLNPEVDCWVDVVAFREAVRAGLHGDGDPLALGAAARLYTGDLLAGFVLPDSPLFEEWLEGLQQRLRQAAVEALGRLLDEALERGDFLLGIDYAHRLLAVEPLSERTHRQLMRLYAEAGRPGRALAHYDRLRELLDRDLGVAPQPETVELRRRLAAARAEDGNRAGGGEEKALEIGPRLPLAGRGAEMKLLRAEYRRAADGGALTLLTGEAGIGKTRLARSFLGSLDAGPETAIRTIRPHPGAVAAVLEAMLAEVRSSPRGTPRAVLFLDDLDWSDDAELGDAARRIENGGRPVWVLAAGRRVPETADTLRGEVLRLGRLTGADVGEICRSLVGRRQAEPLAGAIHSAARGLPLAVAEIVGYLWDESILVADGAGDWRLVADLPAELPGDLEELTRLRLSRLPTTARRLLVAAAALGGPFDRETLIRIEDEHPAVVDACLEVLLDRWWIRWADSDWSSAAPPPDVERWSRGGRGASLELAHERLRQAVLSNLGPRRLRALRRRTERPDVSAGTSASGRGSRA